VGRARDDGMAATISGLLLLEKDTMLTKNRWREFFGMWLTTMGIFTVFLFTNIIMGVIVGAFTSWLLSLTVIGSWIVEGLNLLGVTMRTDALYAVGAAAGFFAGFLKFKIEK